MPYFNIAAIFTLVMVVLVGIPIIPFLIAGQRYLADFSYFVEQA
jgi:hypothetical protein